MQNKWRFYFGIGLLLFALSFSGCQSKKYPNPSDVFYVNDYARVLTAEVKSTIVNYSRLVYKETKNKGEGATQIVVATFLFDDEAAMNLYARDEIYNQWAIGDQDMGLLILMYYIDEVFDGYTLPKFEKFEVAIGSGLIQYVNEIDFGVMMYDAIFPMYLDEEVALVHYYFEAIQRILADAYPGEFAVFDYSDELDEIIDLFTQEEYTFNSLGSRPYSFLYALFNENGFGFLLSGNTTTILIGLLLLVVTGAGGTVLVTKGGGGRSAGGGIFRRRR